MSKLPDGVTEKAEPFPLTAFEIEHEVQAKLLYSMIVAGKSANFADKATRTLLTIASQMAKVTYGKIQPFDLFQQLTSKQLMYCLRKARTGNYTKLWKAIGCVNTAFATKSLDLMTCAPEELEKIHGIGPKTSRFFIMWIRPEEKFAALDVHVLRWLRAKGHDAPKSTPQSTKQYRRLELIFLDYAKQMKKTPRDLDYEIWTAGAGRVQEAALPKDNK